MTPNPLKDKKGRLRGGREERLKRSSGLVLGKKQNGKIAAFFASQGRDTSAPLIKKRS